MKAQDEAHFDSSALGMPSRRLSALSRRRQVASAGAQAVTSVRLTTASGLVGRARRATAKASFTPPPLEAISTGSLRSPILRSTRLNRTTELPSILPWAAIHSGHWGS